MSDLERTINIFYCYAEKDKKMMMQLDEHLAALKISRGIATFSKLNIYAGENNNDILASQLNSANIILLLISPFFMKSDYCYYTAMTRALQRQKNGEAHLVPILLRPTDLQGTPLEKLEKLPGQEKSILDWRDKNRAFLCVAERLRELIDMYYSSGNLAQAGQGIQMIAAETSSRGKKYFKDLHEIFVGARISEIDFHKAYKASISENALIDLRCGISETLLQKMITTLLNMPVDKERVPPILKFSEHCAFQSVQIRESLREWGHTVAKDFGIEPELLEQLRRKLQKERERALNVPSSPLYLLIVLRTLEGDPSAFFVTAWLLHGEEYPDPLDTPEEGKLYTSDAMPRLLDEMLTEISLKPTISDEAKVGLKIEFFLPLELFSLPVEQWKCDEGASSLGALYQVVVRSLDRVFIERTYPQSKPFWKVKWDEVCTLSRAMDSRHIHWIKELALHDRETLYHMLKAPDKQVLCLCLALVPKVIDSQDTKEIFRMMLKAGTPIAFWPKNLPETQEEINRFRKFFKKFIESNEPSVLPVALLKKRHEAVIKKDDTYHIGRSLTLLWDDPNRFPPNEKLRQIEQRR